MGEGNSQNGGGQIISSLNGPHFGQEWVTYKWKHRPTQHRISRSVLQTLPNEIRDEDGAIVSSERDPLGSWREIRQLHTPTTTRLARLKISLVNLQGRAERKTEEASLLGRSLRATWVAVDRGVDQMAAVVLGGPIAVSIGAITFTASDAADKLRIG